MKLINCFIILLIMSLVCCKKENNETTEDILIENNTNNNCNIAYYDVNPDIVLVQPPSNSGTIHEIDVNGDSIPDLRFNISNTIFSNGPHQYDQINSSVEGLNSTEFKSIGSQSGACYYPLDTTMMVDSNAVFIPSMNLQFQNFTVGFQCISFYQGGYIGIKVKKNNLTYYGWIRITCTGSITVYEYALNTCSDEPIRVGAKQ